MRPLSFLQRLKQLQGSPVALARGAAVGVFIAIAPVMPFKTACIVLLTVATGGSAVAGILICTLLCNPLTYAPLYYLAWWVGNLLLPGRATWAVLQAAMERMRGAGWSEALTLAGQVGLDAGLVLLAGGLVLALPAAALSYPLALRFFLTLARKRAEKHLLNAKDRRSTP